MTTTKEYQAMLAPDGQARQFFKKAAPGSEAWVDDFCDGLLERLSLQDRLEALPPCNVNLWLLVGKGKWQVNVDVDKTGSWGCETGDDLLAHLVNRLK